MQKPVLLEILFQSSRAKNSYKTSSRNASNLSIRQIPKAFESHIVRHNVRLDLAYLGNKVQNSLIDSQIDLYVGHLSLQKLMLIYDKNMQTLPRPSLPAGIFNREFGGRNWVDLCSESHHNTFLSRFIHSKLERQSVDQHC